MSYGNKKNSRWKRIQFPLNPLIYFIVTTLVGHVMKTNISLAHDNTYFTNLQLTSIYHMCLQK